MAIINSMARDEYTATSLSKHLNISLSTLSHYLKMLTNANVIDVRPNFDDLRSKKLCLSDSGRALLFMYKNEMLFHPIMMD